MKLPIPIGLPKKEKGEYYLALILRNEKATSIIFEKTGPAIKYISHDDEAFKTTLEDATDEEFLNTLDKVITSAETSLPENVETHKTLFGLKESWIEDNKIKKEYLDKLKKASDELALEPIGFLVFTESIINLLQKDEGAPITAVLAEIGTKYITVSWVKGGKILEAKTSEIHESASYTVDALLKHFQTPGNLPTRIIILDSEEEELTQEFIGHPWSKSLSFLHLPQILSLPEDAPVKAMLLGAATQMQTELVYDSTRINEDEKEPEIVTEEKAEENVPQTPDVSQPAHELMDNKKSLEYFGFLAGKDISKVPVADNFEEKKNQETEKSEIIDEIPEQTKLDEEEKMGVLVNAAFVTAKIKSFAQKLPSILSKIKLNEVLALVKSGNLKNRKLLIVPIVFVILLLVVLYFYFFSTKATVSILVNPLTSEKTTSVTFSSTSATDVPNGVIAADFVTVSENGSVTLPATGKKDIGTPAKGTVTIFNNGDSSVSYPANTTITASNGLAFTLDKAVTVASASGDIFSGTTPGTASVTVTAADIGQEYNFPSGTKFEIGSSVTVAAKNDNAFSGGTKKSVTVVSNDDIQKLLTTLPKQLESKAQSDIKSKVSQDKSVLATFVDESVSNKVFDKNANDQANQVTLKATVDFEAASYTNADILKLSSTLFPASMQISNDNLDVSAKNIVVEKNKDVSADLDIKANLLPKFDQDSLKKEIAGSPEQKAVNIISNMPQVQNVGIVFSPNLFLFPKNLPGNTNNITINVVSK